MEILIIPIMSLLTALSGKSIMTKIPSKLSAFLFSACIGYATYSYLGYYAILATLWTWAWFETSHGNALSWGKQADPDNKHRLTPVVEFIYRGGFGRGYSAVFFSLKGFLLSLPIGGLGIILWPLAYDIGAWLEDFGFDGEYTHMISELLSGLFLGILVYMLIR